MFFKTEHASEEGWGRSAVHRVRDGLATVLDRPLSGTEVSRVCPRFLAGVVVWCLQLAVCNSLLATRIGVAAPLLLCAAAAGIILWSCAVHSVNSHWGGCVKVAHCWCRALLPCNFGAWRLKSIGVAAFLMVSADARSRQQMAAMLNGLLPSPLGQWIAGRKFSALFALFEGR